jgi:hypothetical protein
MLPAPLPATDGSSSTSEDGSCDGSCDGNGSSTGGSNSTSLALLDERSLVALDSTDSGLIVELDTLTCPQPPLGIHSIQTQQLPQAVAWLPEAASTKVRCMVVTRSSNCRGVLWWPLFLSDRGVLWWPLFLSDRGVLWWPLFLSDTCCQVCGWLALVEIAC